MTAWPDADPRGPNGAPMTYPTLVRVPLGGLVGGYDRHAPSPKTREGVAHRAVTWIPNAANGCPVVLWFHGFGVGVRARPNVSDVEFYRLDKQLPLAPRCTVVLPQGGLRGAFGTAQSDPLGYLAEIERAVGVSFGAVVVAAHSGGGEAALQVLPKLGDRLRGALFFEAINGDGQASRFKAAAIVHESAPMRAVYGTSGFYTARHKALAEWVAMRPDRTHVRCVPVHASHNRVMSVGNVFAAMLNEVLGG